MEKRISIFCRVVTTLLLLLFYGLSYAESNNSKKDEKTAPYINAWMMAGPFAVNSAPPAKNIKQWHYVDDRLFSRNYDDYQDVRSWLTTIRKEKADNVEVLAKSFVYSPSKVMCEFRLGADNECDVWLNTVWVGGSQESKPDRDNLKWRVILEKGWNEMLVRVGNQKDGRLGFYARFCSPDGKVVPGLIYSTIDNDGSLTITTQKMAGVKNTLPVAWRQWPYVGMEPLAKIDSTRFPILSRRAHSSAFVFSAAGVKPPYSWRINKGDLPSGLELLSDGSITGTVSEKAKLGKYQFEVSVTDSDGKTVSDRQMIIVKERPNKSIEEDRLIGLIHRPEHTPENGFDEMVKLMKSQGYKMGIVIGYNNGAHTYRWPTKTCFGPLNPNHADAPEMGDVISPYKKALEKHGMKFGFYMGNFNGPNHDGPDGILRVLEEVMDTFHPKLFWFDWAAWQGESLDAAFSVIRARDPECVILVNQAQAGRFGNGDWDLTCMEGWGAWGANTWGAWPHELDWTKRHAMESWRLLPDPSYGPTRNLEADWEELLRVQISMICEGFIADIDHSPSITRNHTYINDRLGSLNESNIILTHRKMAAWANPEGLPPLHESYTRVNTAPIASASWGYGTINLSKNIIYLHVLKNSRGKEGMPKDGKLVVKNLSKKVKSICCMNNGQSLPFIQKGNVVTIDASEIKEDNVDTIMKIKIER